MTELSPEERRVITLAYLEGRSNREIAAAQGVSVSTVRRLLERALKQLDAYLTRTGSWLSAILVLGAVYSAAATARVGRSADLVGSAEWMNRLATTAAVGAVAAAAIGVTAISPDSTSPYTSASPATIQAAAAPPRAGTALPRADATASPIKRPSLPAPPRPVVMAADRVAGINPGVNANGQQVGSPGQANDGCSGNNQNDVPQAAPAGLQKHHPHGPPTSHPPPGACQG